MSEKNGIIVFKGNPMTLLGPELKVGDAATGRGRGTLTGYTGSVKGAMAASLMIGLAETFGQVLVPEAAGMIVYVLMAIVLVWRPEGLFGRA